MVVRCIYIGGILLLDASCMAVFNSVFGFGQSSYLEGESGWRVVLSRGGIGGVKRVNSSFYFLIL